MSSALCQLTTVKARLGLDPFDTADDAILQNMIELACGMIERRCNRTFARGEAVTEEFPGDETEVRPGRYPIESVTQWELKSNETDGWEVQSDVECLIRRSCVVSLALPLGTQRQIGRMTYTGGYVLPGTAPDSGQTALPDEVEHAAVDQVVYWYQNKDRLGITSIASEGGSISQFAGLKLLPHVEMAIKPHERFLN